MAYINQRETASLLKNLILEKLETSEIQALCFDLGFEYDDIQGGGRTEKVVNLVIRLEKRSQLNEAFQWIYANRPDIDFKQHSASTKHLFRSPSLRGKSLPAFLIYILSLTVFILLGIVGFLLFYNNSQTGIANIPTEIIITKEPITTPTKILPEPIVIQLETSTSQPVVAPTNTTTFKTPTSSPTDTLIPTETATKLLTATSDPVPTNTFQPTLTPILPTSTPAPPTLTPTNTPTPIPTLWCELKAIVATSSAPNTCNSIDGYPAVYLGPHAVSEHWGHCVTAHQCTILATPTGNKSDCDVSPNWVYVGPNAAAKHGGYCAKIDHPDYFLSTTVMTDNTKNCGDGVYVGANNASKHWGHCLFLNH